ncbi:MAG: aminotransferase class V-fold PLP-dependent enzyme [Ekhidna sp.]|nr:aminotransferase class V-fold PLP-dependent enzyme [Ekhidna sp.]
MKTQSTNRRSFIRSSLLGVAGATSLPFFSIAKEAVNALPSVSAFADDESYWEAIKKQFQFDEGLTYLNHASLGSSPHTVRKATQAYMETLEKFPSKYMWGGWEEEKEMVRSKVAELFSVSPEEIALNHNTSEGMNLIARSFDLQPGDEIILANHEHASGSIPWEFWQETKGVKIVRPELPLIPESKDEVVAVYQQAITSRTKIISICHVVNTNGMILPVKEVSEMAHEKGILVAVDGAQGAGMFKTNLADLGCDFYSASAHKWLFAPKEVGVLYASKSKQHLLKPLMVARGHKNETIRRLETYNTRSLPEVLGLGSAIDFINEVTMERIHNRTYELKSYLREKLEGNDKFRLKAPANDDLSAAIQSVEVVGKKVGEVKQQLYEEFGIDCRPMSKFGLNGLRISMSIYITKSDIDYLVSSLESIAG